jgi:hypothetical protein
MYKVLKEFKGTEDGFTVIEFKVGEEVPLGAALAAVALEEQWVEEVESAQPASIEVVPDQAVEIAADAPSTETKPEAKPRHRR